MTLSISLDTAATQLRIPENPTRRRRSFLTPLEIPDEYLLVVDNTAAEKIMTCHTAARNYLIFERQAHAKNAALTFGGAVHAGREAFLLGRSVDEQNAAIVTYFTDNPSPPDEYRTVNNAIEVLKHYRVQCEFPDYERKLHSDAHGPIVERPFELPLGVIELNTKLQLPQWDTPRYVRRIHVAWSGRIDDVSFCNGMNRVEDLKTSSIDGDQFIQDFILSNQTIGYCWAANQLWPELAPFGFCLDVIRLKKPTGSCGLMERGPRGGEPALKFFRAYFQYSDERLCRWERNALTAIADFVHSVVRDFYVMETKWCFSKYGRCEYHDCCTIDDEVVGLRLLKSDAYRQVTWDPTI